MKVLVPISSRSPICFYVLDYSYVANAIWLAFLSWTYSSQKQLAFCNVLNCNFVSTDGQQFLFGCSCSFPLFGAHVWPSGCATGLCEQSAKEWVSGGCLLNFFPTKYWQEHRLKFWFEYFFTILFFIKFVFVLNNWSICCIVFFFH